VKTPILSLVPVGLCVKLASARELEATQVNVEFQAGTLVLDARLAVIDLHDRSSVLRTGLSRPYE
jgi:hypothetical protein